MDIKAKLLIIYRWAPFVLILTAILLGLIKSQSRNYWLTDANVNITINREGEIYIREDIGYKFKGC
ncbi:MAG: hypothetical protein QXU20_00130 [Candidatus Woesearchaeota archaeon]